jgi:predicted DNA-binding WGR domain protein
MMRFYAIWIAPTLFGEWAMVREWGRVGSPGRLGESWFATEKIANQAGLTLKKKEGGTRISRRLNVLPWRSVG